MDSRASSSVEGLGGAMMKAYERERKRKMVMFAVLKEHSGCVGYCHSVMHDLLVYIHAHYMHITCTIHLPICITL